jgi:cysteine desulfurase / selenocysteine lyase
LARTVAPDFAVVRREEFATLQSTTYFNAASAGVLPACAVDVVGDALARRAAGRLTADDFEAVAVDARVAAAALVGGNASEITLTPNTTVALNLAAALLVARRNAGDGRRTIVVSRGEFPANVYSWLALRRDGFEVRFTELRPDGGVDEDALAAAAGAPDTAAVALSSVQFATGYRSDIVRLGQACRAGGALFVVDAIQHLGAVSIDAAGSGIDVLACGAQKWLCSPFGTGFAWIAPEAAFGVEPLLPGWLGFSATQDFTTLVDYSYELLPDGRRFEAGTLPFHDLLGFTAALRLINRIGVDRIAAHIAAVQAPLRAWASDRGVRVAGGDALAVRSGILALELPGGTAAAAIARLEAAAVQCVVREGLLRLSPHFYNTVDEAERVVDVLDGVVPR